MSEQHVELRIPKKMEFEHHGSHIEIIRSWWHWSVLFLTVWAVFWDAFLIVWYTIFFKEIYQQGISFFFLLFLLFPLIHVAIGVGVTHQVLTIWLNKTHIYVDPTKITVRHRPIPSRGNKEIQTSDIKHLCVEKHLYSHHRGEYISYEVQVILHSGKNIKLLSGLTMDEQAFFIKQEIERYLRIKDANHI